jgi:adenine phosphoribosyltransferase
VLLVDDLIATGGTALAAVGLLSRLDADIVACAFIVDLPDSGGAARLSAAGYRVITLCAYGGD